MATVGAGVDDVVLHLSVDLLMTDFLGLSVILADFEAALMGRTPQPPSLTFRDHVLTSRAYANTPPARAERERAESYWMDRAGSLPEVITLSPEVSHPAAAANEQHDPVRFTRRSHLMDAVSWARLEDMAREQGLTATSLVVAALGRVLHRHGGPARGLVAMTVLDRQSFTDDVERIVGDFTSTVLVDVDGRPGVPLAELAASTQDSIFEALEHRAISGVKLARMVADHRGEERFSAPVVVTSTVGMAPAIHEAVLRPRPSHGISQTPQVLLDVQLSPQPGGAVSLDWDSRDGGFSAAILDAAFADFTTMLERIVGEGLPTDDPLPPRAPDPIIRTGRQTDAPRTLHEPVLQRCQEDPTAPAVVDGDRQVSRSRLVAAAAVVARWLAPERTLGCICRVAVVLPPGAAQTAVELGVLMSGACYVPVEPDWPQARREAVVATLEREGQSLVVDADHPLLADVLRTLADDEYQDVDLPEMVVDGDSEAYVIFTSGSTGRPKGVVVTHAQARTTLDDLEERLGLGAGDAVLAVSRHSFDLSVFNTFGILGAGGRMVVPTCGTTADPQCWLDALRRHHVTVWNSVPAQLQLVLDQLVGLAAEQNNPLPLRAVMVSGDWVPVDQPAQLWQHAPRARFLSLGGATEAAIWSVLHEVHEPLPTTARSVPYGRALNDQGIWVLNANDEPAGISQIGDIVIGGDGVAAGYLGDPERTAAAFFQHPVTGERCYRTGDRGRLVVDGDIEFLGRVDGQVKIRGHRIELGEIESVLGSCEGVARAVAAVAGPTGEDDHRDRSGRHLVAAVQPTLDPGYARERAVRTAAVVAAMQRIDRQIVDIVNSDGLRELARLVDESAVAHLAAQIARGAGADTAALIATLDAAGHADLVGRWLSLLVERGWVGLNDGLVTMHREPDLSGDAERWRRIRELDALVGYGTRQLDYVKQCLDDLPGLLRGDVDPLALLFPDGATHVARAAYGENLFGRWINGVITAGIVERARQARTVGRRLRVLEIGGGVGGTTEPVLQALAAELGEDLDGVDYLFTDVSHYFFAEITQRWPMLHTALFDLNDEPSRSGIVPGSVDVTLAANVLHNARDIPAALERLASLLAPGGALAMIDSTAVSAPLMASMEFKEGLTDFANLRQRTGRPFLSLTEWFDVLQHSPFRLAASFPEHDSHVMRVGDQHAFWATTGDYRADLSPDQLREQVADALPQYMVPKTVALVDTIPLTSNGKIDRLQIAAMARASDQGGPAGTRTVELDADQERVAVVWRDVLGLDGDAAIGPAADFFDLGGDSLLLARCIGRLRREVPGGEAVAWDEALRRIVTDPTLAGCARALVPDCRRVERTASVEKPLVELLPARAFDNEREVLVLVHDGSGDLSPYRDLVAALGRTTPCPRVVGLRRIPGDGYLETDPAELFDRLSDRYADELIALGADRVHLFGYCMGGLIATGLASRLAETADAEVASCTVVSSYRIPFTVEDELMLDYSLARLMHRDPADAGIDVNEQALGRALDAVRRQTPTVIAEGAVRRLAEPGLAAALDRAPDTCAERLERLATTDPQGEWTADSLAGLREVFRHSLAAVAAWDAPAYLGDIRFLRQRGEIHFLPTLRENMTDFWAEHCLGELEVCDIDGNHFDCLTDLNATAVAAIVARGWRR